MAAHACPNCNSDDTSTLKMVWMSGTSDIQSKMTGVGVGVTGHGLGIGAGVGKTKGTSKTLLSQAAQPPLPPKYTEALVVALLAGLGVAFFLFMGLLSDASSDGEIGVVYEWTIMIAASAVAVAVYKVTSKSNANSKKAYENRLAEYERQWICLRCGSKFKPTDK